MWYHVFNQIFHALHPTAPGVPPRLVAEETLASVDEIRLSLEVEGALLRGETHRERGPSSLRMEFSWRTRAVTLHLALDSAGRWGVESSAGPFVVHPSALYPLDCDEVLVKAIAAHVGPALELPAPYRYWGDTHALERQLDVVEGRWPHPRRDCLWGTYDARGERCLTHSNACTRRWGYLRRGRAAYAEAQTAYAEVAAELNAHGVDPAKILRLARLHLLDEGGAAPLARYVAEASSGDAVYRDPPPYGEELEYDKE